MKSEESRGFVWGWAKLGLACLAFCAAVVGFAAESISITATPRYPWNGKVDLKFTIDGTSGTKYDTSFTAKDVAGGTNLTMKTLAKSDGTAANVAKEQLLPGTYNWVWDTTADLTSRWSSYASCVPTSSTVLFKNTQLAAVAEFYAVPCGTAISDKSNRVKGRWVKADGAGKSVQFAFSDDKYTKCVCVHFEQSGVGVVGYVKWARYVSGLGHENEDFDANSATTQTIATSETASGYGLCKLEARVPQPVPSIVLDRVVVEGEVKVPVYYVKFNANGGSGTMENQSFYGGQEQELTANKFTMSGYDFFGWSLSSSAVRAYTNKQKVTDLSTKDGDVVNLYAIWTKSKLGEGINCTTLPWTTDSKNPWSYFTPEEVNGEMVYPYDKKHGVKSSGAGGGVADSWIQTTIKGPATFSFRYGSRYITGYDGSFTVTCDSKEIYKETSPCGIFGDWTYKSFTLSAGVHVIRFNYHHCGYGYPGGGNGVRMDDFKVTYK